MQARPSVLTDPRDPALGNLRVDVLDLSGEQVLTHGRLVLEPAPPVGIWERGRLQVDREVEEGRYALRLTTGSLWDVELRHELGAPGMAVISADPPALSEVGGE